MADRLDVAERLDEGRPAVEHTSAYVQACHVLGYRHPDLTSHPSQVRDWYESDDGMDLRALDNDCSALRAAGAAVTEALRLQRAQFAELAAAWTGPGADAAFRALERHCDTAAVVADELRAAAQRCESLRDNLWFLVDSKVATAIVIDDRTRAQRQAWLAAATAVTGGTGDRRDAEQLIREQVQPYVHEDIRNDWLATMRSTVDAVTTSYDMVIDRMAAAVAVHFEVPGDLAPGYQAAGPAPPIAPTVAASVVPAALASDPPMAPAPAPTLVPPLPNPPPAAAATPPDWGAALGEAGMPAGQLGGGLGGSGNGGLAGLASRIVAAVGDLIGSATDGAGGDDPFGDDTVHDDAFHPDQRDGEPDESEGANEVTEPKDTEPDAQIQPVDAQVAAPPPPPLDAAPPPDAPVPDAAPAPAVAQAPAAENGSTPCEIAADQLPQAGQ